MPTERRRLSVTITGPEVDMLEAMAVLLRRQGYKAMAVLLRRQGYLVFEPGDDRVTVTRKSRAVLTALRGVTDGQLDELARSWRFARLEHERREVELDDI